MKIGEMAEVISRVLGKPIEYVNLSIDQWRKILIEKPGVPGDPLGGGGAGPSRRCLQLVLSLIVYTLIAKW